MRDCAAEAVEGDASFLVFPEQCLTGWNPSDDSLATDESGENISTIREIAQDYSIGILGSFREKDTDKLYNTCIAIGTDGKTLSKYRKIHLFSPGGEDNMYSPGESPCFFPYDSCLLGIAICYDLRFASVFQAYRDAGINLMLVPSAWPAARIKHFHLFTRSRALEFQTFVASVNTVGQTPVDSYNGGSCIAGPDGTVRAMGSDREDLIFFEIDPLEAETIRKEFPVNLEKK